MQERPEGPELPALAYQATGSFPWQPGTPVWINATARCLGLGSGGFDLVLAPCAPQHAAPSAAARLDRRHGHVMKLRYTPLQMAVRACEEPRGGYHACLRRAYSLRGFPVGVVALHSMLAPAVCAFVLARGCQTPPRVACVLTDSAALPAAVSRLLERLERRRLLRLVVTCGQAFGGHLEAVNVASALAVCARSGAMAALVAPGPGVVGTGTALGTSCLEVASVADTAAAMGASVAVALRIGSGDRRLRHRGVSHHLLTALGWLASRRHWVVLPAGLPRPQRRRVLSQLQVWGILRRHRVVEVCAPRRQALMALLGDPWESMGRNADQEPALWEAAAACGYFLALRASM